MDKRLQHADEVEYSSTKKLLTEWLLNEEERMQASVCPAAMHVWFSVPDNHSNHGLFTGFSIGA